MHVPGMMHMLHALEACLVLPYPSMSSKTLLWHGSKQEPTLLHCKCCPALPAIVHAGPLHGANGPG